MKEKRNNDESRQVFKFMPLSLHLETVGGLATPIVLRGTKLPVTRTKTFTTAEDNQKNIEVHLLMGESPLAGYNHSIGKFLLRDIEKAKKGVPQIRLNMEVNENCRINLEITELGSQNTVREEVPIPEDLLDKKQIENVLKEADARKNVDEIAVKSIEIRNEANQRIAEAELLLSRDHNSVLERGIAELGLALESGQNETIESATSDLEALLIEMNTQFSGMFPTGDIFSEVFGNRKTRPAQTVSAKRRIDNPKESRKKGVVKGLGISNQQIGKVFGGGTYTMESNLCFVLMPFSKDMDEVYEDHIKAIVENEGFSCIRADEIVGTNAIIKDIWERINRARFLIADLTARNPNVFYEVGLAHAIGKEVILMTQNINDVPFDLRQLRCIVYSWNPRGAKELEKRLVSTIKGIMRAG